MAGQRVQTSGENVSWVGEDAWCVFVKMFQFLYLLSRVNTQIYDVCVLVNV